MLFQYVKTFFNVLMALFLAVSIIAIISIDYRDQNTDNVDARQF